MFQVLLFCVLASWRFGGTSCVHLLGYSNWLQDGTMCCSTLQSVSIVRCESKNVLSSTCLQCQLGLTYFNPWDGDSMSFRNVSINMQTTGVKAQKSKVWTVCDTHVCGWICWVQTKTKFRGLIFWDVAFKIALKSFDWWWWWRRRRRRRW